MAMALSTPCVVEESEAFRSASTVQLAGFSLMRNTPTDGVDPATVRPDALSALPRAGLGKRQGNLLTAVLRGIPLMGRHHMVPFAEADVRKCLAQFPLVEDKEAAGKANPLRPKLLDAVVGPVARLHGYILGLPDHGVEPLLEAVGRAVRSPLVLRVVFGATVEMPLRALSYVLPAVGMAVRIRAVTGKTPYVQVLYIGALGGRINGLPASTVADEGRLLADCLDRVLTKSEVAVHYGVYVNRPVPAGEEATEDLIERLDERRRQDIAERLHGKGGSLSDHQTLQYAAAHVLLHDHDRVPLDQVCGTQAPASPVVIDIGGLQERHFYGVRMIFAEVEPFVRPGPLVLTRHSVPPYIMSHGGDIGLRDYLSGAAVDMTRLPAAVRHDLQLLSRSTFLDPLR